MTKKTPPKVLFVCLGNICRSPTAEAVLRKRAFEQGLSDIEIDSAGTGNWHVGEPPDPRAIAAGKARGYDLSGLRARQVSVQDFENFTHILAMDSQNLAHLAQMARSRRNMTDPANLHLFLTFGNKTLRDVPDPYFGGTDGFASVLELIEATCDGLIRSLKQN